MAQHRAPRRARSGPKIDALARRAYDAAREAGLTAKRSRRRLGSTVNHGGFCLLGPEGTVVAGQRYALTPLDVVRVSDQWTRLEALKGWMTRQGWQPLPHQEALWSAQLDGEEGLLCVPTGSGKSYAAYLAALAQVASDPGEGLRVLWLSPLRAMATDIEAALRAPVDALGWPIAVASRTGDTSAYRKRKLRERLPQVLVTTPESLTLLLSYEDAAEKFASLQTVVVDEWHELLGSKRGTQTELALTRLRRYAPAVKTWALSATLAAPERAARAAVGPGRAARVITTEDRPALRLHTLLGPEDAYLPWFGYLGGSLFDAVVEVLDPARSTLIFTNTRNQAEQWYRAIMERRPEWFAVSGVHHGAIDGAERRRIEAGLADGSVTLVVCTSSFDLGVDFGAVERVFQIGSPRSVARLLQRAGRSGHRPGAASELYLVPTHAMQLVEFAALRRALAAGVIEERAPLEAPLDVLVQHLVTCAAAGGFDAEELWREVRGSWAYRDLPRSTFDWALRFLVSGGSTLQSYEHYHRLARDDDGRFRLRSAAVGRRHRLAIGTITANASLRVRFKNGREIGHIEEAAIARLAPGDRFLFAGRALELVMTRGDDVYVRATRSADHAPKWLGDELPFSEPLSALTVAILGEVRGRLERGDEDLHDLGVEIARAAPLLRRQARSARIPAAGTLLAEICQTPKDGCQLFLFTFAGHAANRLLAPLLAWRISRTREITFALTANDYALELHTPEAFDFAAVLKEPGLLSSEDLEAHVTAAVNATELGRRQFRRVARIAGLLHEGLPGARRGARQLQTSAGLLYDVFARYEPDNLLLAQAQRETLESQFDLPRIRALLDRLAAVPLDVVHTARPSPMAFPLSLERVSARLSSESARTRLARLKRQWTEAMAAP